MTERMHRRLKPVRNRQHRLFVAKTGAVGLLIGSVAAVLPAGLRLLGVELSPAVPIVLAAAGLMLGLLTGLVWRRGWKTAAVAVDSHYRLKDRAETALAFLDKDQATVLHELQITDTIDHLRQIDARQVVPLKMPRALPYALVALAVAVGLTLIPPSGAVAEAAPAEPLAQIVQEAESLEKSMIEELEELAKEEPDEKLEKLVDELKELVAEMKEPGVDHRDALAKLSEMQAAIAAAMAEYNLEAVDAALQAVAEAMAPAEAMRAAAKSLQEGKYNKAAEQLERIDPSQIAPKEAKTITKKLAKVLQDMQDANQGQLSDATTLLCEGLESGDESKCKSGACKLAGLCRKQGLRKGIAKCLGCQLGKLAECKGACRGNGNGGSSVAKSDSPKNTWGLGASGKPLGEEATSIDSNRNRRDITGTQGDGPSEKAVFHAPDGRQQAARSYREEYEKFQKMSEAVLQSESLPLGHRQTIRRYFESIRPQNADSEVLPKK
ncbi:MAG: hypothetical protein V3R99_02940 [Thermoguttaceae bacterium]